MIDGHVEVVEIDALDGQRGDRFARRTSFDPRTLAPRTAGSGSSHVGSRPGARRTSWPAVT